MLPMFKLKKTSGVHWAHLCFNKQQDTTMGMVAEPLFVFASLEDAYYALNESWLDELQATPELELYIRNRAAANFSQGHLKHLVNTKDAAMDNFLLFPKDYTNFSEAMEWLHKPALHKAHKITRMNLLRSAIAVPDEPWLLNFFQPIIPLDLLLTKILDVYQYQLKKPVYVNCHLDEITRLSPELLDRIRPLPVPVKKPRATKPKDPNAPPKTRKKKAVDAASSDQT